MADTKPPRKVLILDLNKILCFRKFTSGIQDTEADFTVGKYNCWIRPYLKDFLDFIFIEFDVIVWTSMSRENALKLVQIFFKNHNRRLKHVFTRDDCKVEPNSYIGYKNIKLVTFMFPQYTKKDIVCIEDTTEKYKNDKDNILLVDEFVGDKTDNELNVVILKLRKYLDGASLEDLNLEKIFSKLTF